MFSIKRVFAVLAVLLTSFYAVAAMAAVDVNTATAAELDAVKGIGPSISGKIIEERKHGAFKDWNDLTARVKGIGEKNAKKFSDNGLTVNGAADAGTSAKAAAKSTAKPAAKTDMKADAKADAKVEAKADTKAMAKTDAKADAKAKAETKAPAAKVESKPAAASAAAPAASSAKAGKKAKK